MSADDLPMMPFFVKDWLAATMHWPCAERGAYISLLSFQWCNGSVPPDVSQLARIAGVNEGDFERIWLTVGAKFDADDTGLFNRRLEEHRKEALRLRDARTLGATLANQKRRARRDAERGSTPVPRDDAERTHPSTSTSTSTSSEEEKKTARARPARAQRVLRGTYDLSADDDWLNFKLAFPARAGGQPWRAAMKAWRARVAEGHDPKEFVAGAERYATWIKARGDERTAYVMHAKTFLGPEKYFLQDWDPPLEAANDERWSPPSDDLAESA